MIAGRATRLPRPGGGLSYPEAPRTFARQIAAVPLQGATCPNIGSPELNQFRIQQESEMMNLVYYQPWSLMDRWHREIDELFTRKSRTHHTPP